MTRSLSSSTTRGLLPSTRMMGSSSFSEGAVVALLVSVNKDRFFNGDREGDDNGDDVLDLENDGLKGL